MVSRSLFLWTCALFLLLVAAIVLLVVHDEDAKAAAAKRTAAQANASVAASAATVTKGNIGIYLDSIGTVTPVYTSSITAQASGVIGRLFREFAVTLAVTIILSAVVSLTLTPMMCSRILRHTPEDQQGRFFRASERVFNNIIAFYRRTLKFVLSYQTITLLVAVATLALTIVLYIVIPKGLFPTQDTGEIQGISQAPATITFAAMSQKQQQLAHVVLQDPAVESLSSFIGADGTNTTLNSGRMSINLKPLNVRNIGASDVIRRLQSSLKSVEGATLYMEPVQNITVDDRVSRTQYQYTLEDADANELNLWAGRLVAKMQHLPQLADVATDQQTGGLEVSLVIDRATATRLGIAPSTIDSTLYDAYGQRQINTMYTQLNQYHVILETTPSVQQNPGKLQDLFIQTNTSSGTSGPAASSSYASSGSSSAGSNATTSAVAYTPSSQVLTAPTNAITSGVGASSSAHSAASTPNAVSSSTPSNAVPLSAFTHVESGTESLSINHQGQFSAVTISFNLAPNAALGGAIDEIEKAQKQLNMPASVQFGFHGTAAAFQGSLANEGLLILAALAAVYIVLGVLYESFIHPITILSTLPSAGVGALLALILFRQDLSVVAIIGIILLIGIVKKNGIMMVDFAMEGERRHGNSATDAIYEACLLRFRPIMMTTMAALLAGIPLALGQGMGSELRRPLGIAMVGGLLLSQLLTLYTTPVIHIFFDRIGQRFSPSKQVAGNEPQPAEEGA